MSLYLLGEEPRRALPIRQRAPSTPSRVEQKAGKVLALGVYDTNIAPKCSPSDPDAIYRIRRGVGKFSVASLLFRLYFDCGGGQMNNQSSPTKFLREPSALTHLQTQQAANPELQVARLYRVSRQVQSSLRSLQHFV